MPTYVAEFDYSLHTSARVTHKLVVVEETVDVLNHYANLRIYIERTNSGREHDADSQSIELKINGENVDCTNSGTPVLGENSSDIVELKPNRHEDYFKVNYNSDGTKNVKIELTYKSERVGLVVANLWGTIANAELSFDLPAIDMSLPEISNISVKADRYGLNASASFTAEHSSYNLYEVVFKISGLTSSQRWGIYNTHRNQYSQSDFDNTGHGQDYGYNSDGTYWVEIKLVYPIKKSLLNVVLDLDDRYYSSPSSLDSGGSYPWELTVTAYNGKTVTRTGTLKVPQKVTGVTCESQLEIPLRKTDTLEYQVEPYNAEYPAVEFSSSDPSVATVDKNTGLITAVDDGVCQITVTTFDGGSPDASKGFSAVCTVYVLNTDKFPALTEIRYLTVRDISKIIFACTFLSEKLAKNGISVPDLSVVACEGKSHPVKEIKSLLETIDSNCRVLKNAASLFYQFEHLSEKQNIISRNDEYNWYLMVNEWIKFLNELNSLTEKEA